MNIENHVALYTDYYELTMAQGYYLAGRAETTAGFDYFFRKNPFEGGYVIFAGLSDLLPYLENFRFSKEDIGYLESLNFNKGFLDYLKSFRFKGEIYAPREGEVVFPLETIVRVKGNIIETQIVETLLLNILNFESLIATKATRIREVAQDRKFIDFGLRRSQGWGGIQASKASIIGGADATSNVYAAFKHHIEPSGTQAHSWIQSFDDELTAFRQFAEFYPDSCVLLVDTYNTLESGVPNAIKVGKELEKDGHRLLGIRLDSGDLAYLSRKARKMLDDAGLDYVKIAASNQLDEYLIKSLLDQNAPIDLFGVGTRLVTAYDSPALDGVYKLSMINNRPKLKISENITKVNLPGVKKVLRLFHPDGYFYGDGVMLDKENELEHIYHPHFPEKNVDVSNLEKEEILHKVMENGKIVTELEKPKDCAQYAQERLSMLQKEHRRFENPHYYKVGLSKKLHDLRSELMNLAPKKKA
ncbi:MAG TPA: nicotinate phosphoribosyltransferase [Balneolales bacterium]|nr:nicotinate phosphoribosyltransferase [Balneolales bacterium]